MKEVVIKIPDEIYEWVRDNILFTSNIEGEDFLRTKHELTGAIAHGKVLPKGHRRLIEVTPRLEMYLSTFQSYTGIDEAPYEYADELIRNADTVVEADKGEE